MDALEAPRDHRFHAEQLGALRRPVARAAGAVFLAGENHRGRAARHVGHRRVVDRRLTALRLQQRKAAFDAGAVGFRRQHEILDPNVAKRSAHHDLVVAAAAAVAVEIGHRDIVLEQIDSRRRCRLDRSRGADVVGGDRVAENAQRACAAHRGDRRRLHGEVPEERRLGDVRRLVPRVDLTGRRRDGVPQGVVLGEVAVEASIRRRIGGVLHHRADLLGRRPDVTQINRLAVVAGAERLGRHVDIGAAGNRVGDHLRLRGEEIRLDAWMNARLEVAIPRQHRGAHQIVLGDDFLDRRVERPGVADARRAAIAGEIEVELFELRQQSRLGQILGHHARSRS